MDAAELQARNELDRDILAYVREMQQHAPVTEESVHGFETGIRRRRVTPGQVRDRLAYLVNAGYLAKSVRWESGRGVEEYTCTAEGMDLLDGAIPPRNWNK